MNETNGVLWHRTGPRLQLDNLGRDVDARHRYALRIDDLNPSVAVTWAFSRGEMVRIGWWFIRRALFARHVPVSRDDDLSDFDAAFGID